MEIAEGTHYLFCAYSQRKASKGQQLVSVRPSVHSLNFDKSTLTEQKFVNILKICRLFQLPLIYDRKKGALYFSLGKVIDRKGFLCGVIA
jgi:hypothetical protein